MRTGRLNNEAAIQQAASAQDAIGGEAKTWSAYCASWPCELVQVRGGEAFRGRTVHAQANHVADGWYVEGVTASMRVVLGSRVFDILAADNVNNKNERLRLHLLERGL